MKIVIDIPEDTYYDMKAHEEQVRLCDNKFKTAVLDGTPLAEVIEDIKSEIKELSELDHAEPTYEDCKRDVLEIIEKHISGAKEGEE